VRNASLLVAISFNADGYRQILGIVEGAKEDKAGWSAFLAHLKGRGLRGVELIVSDACMRTYDTQPFRVPRSAM
jgi:putative transposase